MNAEIIFLDGHARSDDDTLSAASGLLAELLDAYGISQEKERIYEALPYGHMQLELVDVLNFMARMGYTGGSIPAYANDLDARLLPCLFVDEKSGTLCVLTEPAEDAIPGTAYIFTKMEHNDPKEQKEALAAAGTGWFLSAVLRFRQLGMRVALISLVLNIVSLGLPLFLMAIYDRIVDITTFQTVLVLGTGAVLTLGIELCLRNMRSRNLAWFAARIDHIVSNRVLSRLLQLPAHALERASVASQIARLRSFDSVREFFSGPLFLTLLDLPFTLLAFLVLVAIGGSMAFVPLGVIALYGVLIAIFRPQLKLAMFKSARARATVQSHHIELYEKREALRLGGMCDVWREQFREISAESSIAMFRAQHLAQMLEIAIYTITTLAGLMLIYMGVLRAWDGLMSGGALFASLILFWRVIAPWQMLSQSIPRLEQLYRSIQQINRLMTLDTEYESALGLGKPGHVRGGLSFSKIGLRYSKESDPVFVGLNFSVAPGEMVAVAGANGSGKSTLLKLVLGLYRPQAGAIYLDGRDIRQLDPVRLRQAIAYVPQIPELFEGTIADNLRMGNPAATDSQLWHALELADAKRHVASLPDGLDTSVLACSSLLRSSLTHQIVLARAYVKDAPILLIDELPYTLLNSHAGHVFIEQLQRWKQHKTILMITHRDDHIRMCDRAVGLLEGGRFVMGTPDTVITQLRDESYSHLLKRTP